ncbi:ferric reductase-like transmembrane domain-containing protein [Zoogloea sp.]|uniref:ferric reductase-like transmembrane domain-containing protein n=1 Tax=Zoogloea sp. TaxID=49181 RepID=UPI00260A53EF|nr:ferric reductase-like transmembrane domain-containing protein [Zoogloea sp.]MDD3353572.1 ferric reductase-like transmembrane domain-containing protein [Zoogloea sp.]
MTLPATLRAPLLCLILPASAVLWAWPEGLPPWRGLAIITAWTGTGLLLASLLLMLRQPRLAEHLGGLSNSYRWHHLSGTLAYISLLLHPLALAADGFTEDPRTAWLALAPWALGWPENLGWLALLLLMGGLAGSFGPPLAYRPWRAVHFLLGAGVVLGLAHVWALLGNASGVLLALFVCLFSLGWRLLADDRGWGAAPYRVSSVRACARDSIEATLTPCSRALPARPGQFVLAAFGDGGHFHGSKEFHPFTLSEVGDNGQLRMAIKALGHCTRHLQALEPGVLVRLAGPFGEAAQTLPDGRPRLWIAGGIGITPFMALLRQETSGPPTDLLHVFRRAEEAPFLDELESLARQRPELNYLPRATGDGPAPLADMLAPLDSLEERSVYLCGPPGLVDLARRLLLARGVNALRIHHDSFDFRGS